MPQSEISNKEVRAAIHSLPPWITRWGNSIIFLLILVTVLICYLIKFTDRVPVAISIKALPEPRQIALADDGVLTILKTDNAMVNAGDTLFVVKNTSGKIYAGTAPFSGTIKCLVTDATPKLHYKNESIFSLSPSEKHFSFSTISYNKGLPPVVKEGQQLLLPVPGQPDKIVQGVIKKIVNSANPDSAILLLQFKVRDDSILRYSNSRSWVTDTSCEIITARTTLLQKLLFKSK